MMQKNTGTSETAFYEINNLDSKPQGRVLLFIYFYFCSFNGV